MKRSLALLTLFSILALAQNDGNDQPGVPPKKAYVRALENLAPEKLEKYKEHYLRAEQLFGQKRIFECLEVLRKASQIFDGNPAVFNLRGACYVEFRDFSKAAKAFAAALEADPNNMNVLFNLAEVQFVTQNWPEALEKLTTLKPTLEKAGNESMADLVDFKIMLCLLKLDRIEEATKIITPLSYRDDTPLYYYGNASLAYHAEESTKAEAWLARGRRVFRNQAILAPWQDTLIEFGYIKSFYGGDLETEEE